MTPALSAFNWIAFIQNVTGFAAVNIESRPDCVAFVAGGVPTSARDRFAYPDVGVLRIEFRTVSNR